MTDRGRLIRRVERVAERLRMARAAHKVYLGRLRLGEELCLDLQYAVLRAEGRDLAGAQEDYWRYRGRLYCHQCDVELVLCMMSTYRAQLERAILELEEL